MSAIWSTTIWKRTKPRVILDGIIFSDRLSVLPFVRPSVFQCGKNLQKEKKGKRRPIKHYESERVLLLLLLLLVFSCQRRDRWRCDICDVSIKLVWRTPKRPWPTAGNCEKSHLSVAEKKRQRERDGYNRKKRERNNRSHLDKTHLCLLDFFSFLVFLSLVQPFYFYNFNQVHKSSSWISDRPTSSEFKSIKSQLTFDKKNEFNISLQGLVPESTCQMEEEEEDQQCFPIV